MSACDLYSERLMCRLAWIRVKVATAGATEPISAASTSAYFCTRICSSVKCCLLHWVAWRVVNKVCYTIGLQKQKGAACSGCSMLEASG
jgi:hypothetical protein